MTCSTPVHEIDAHFLPNGVMLPTYLNNGHGLSGQNGGILWANMDLWQIKQDPDAPGFRVDELALTAGQFHDRRTLLDAIDGQAHALEGLASSKHFRSMRDKTRLGITQLITFVHQVNCRVAYRASSISPDFR